ncbi:unnamed protein product, partial [Musa hybrid cultivar]
RPAPRRRRRYLLRDHRLHPLPSGATAAQPLLAGGGDYATSSLPSVSPSPHPPLATARDGRSPRRSTGGELGEANGDWWTEGGAERRKCDRW